MRALNFRAASLAVVISLALLITVEAIWAIRSYHDMRDNYTWQINSILEEASWKYGLNPLYADSIICIGNISRLHAFVSEGLRMSGLTTEFSVEVLSTTDTEPVAFMTMGNIPEDIDIISVDKRTEPIILRLNVADPHTSILANMRRTLILQILSIIVLIATFAYLLRTLFRAKEVDKIRQDLTHNITHELKTPIAAAHAATEALRTMTEIAEDRATRNDYLDISLSELKRLNQMVEEILRSSTEEFATAELRLEECDIASIVNQIYSSLDMRYVARKVEWHIEIESGCTVVADRFHLEGAISAIADNAIKYSTDTPSVTISASTKSGYTYINIEDKGCGISPNEQRRIFDKFYRIPQQYKTAGYGLGLYYVKGVVKRHSGSIAIESAVGRGSRFTIKLPRYGK